MRNAHPDYSARNGLSRVLMLRVTLLMVGLTLMPVSGQNVLYTENKFDLTHRSSFKVDPASLALQIEIPLTNHAGRAGTNFPTTLNYSSKVWKVEYYGESYEGGQTYYDSDAYFGYDSESGWNGMVLGEGPAPYVTHSVDWYFSDGDPYDTGSGPPCACPGSCSKGSWDEFGSCQYPDDFRWNPPGYMPRLQVHLPNGRVYQLRKPPETFVAEGQPVYAGDFVAVDGSQTKYDATNNIFYLPDGSRYYNLERSFDPDAETSYQDRNGNLLQLTETNTWTDTLGRTYSSTQTPLENAIGYDRVLDLPGISGTRQTYTLRFRPLYQPPVPPAAEQWILTNPAEGLQYVAILEWNKRIFGPTGWLSPFNPVVLHQLVLPNGKIFTFTYNNWGEIDKVVYPTGGYERFRYDKVAALGYIPPPNDEFNRGVVERWVSAKGDGSDAIHWTYSTSIQEPSASERYVTRIETNPDGTRSERVFRGEEAMDWRYYGFKDCRVGTLVEERTYSATGDILQRRLNSWIMTGTLDPDPNRFPGGAPSRNPRLERSVEVLFDHYAYSAKAKAVRYVYDSDLNPSQISYFEYRSVTEAQGESGGIDDPALADGDLLKYDTTTYQVNETGGQAYRDRHMISLPSYSRTWDPQGVLQAQTALRYDEYLVFSYGSTLNWSDPGAVRGNVTTTLQRIDASGANIETHAHYDQFGNQIERQDGREKVWETEFSPDYAYAYPTLQLTPVPDPTGQQASDSELEASTGYDFGTGLVIWTQDANTKTTNYTYADSLYRLTQVDYPDGGQVQYVYNDTAGQVSQTARTKLDASPLRYITKQESFDGLGRLRSTVLTEDGGSIHQDTEYDALGRVWRVSNPYRTGLPVWTETHYDALNRITEVIQPDGAVTATEYASNETTVVDPSGNSRVSVNDALGRLVQVIEDPLVSGYETFYGYDVLGNLTAVSQGVQNRAFVYDGLSRLLSATNPESGLMTYQYDGNGNVTLRVDARGTSTSYTYDGINRVVSRSYGEEPIRPSRRTSHTATTGSEPAGPIL
jgi:YD repeat-containing protein